MFRIDQTVSTYLNVIVTHECNMKCAFCIDKYRGESLFITDEQVSSALSFAKENGIKTILLIGGEPTLHPDIVSIASRFKSAGFEVVLTTNYKLPDVVKALDGIVDSFNISYYSQKELPKQGDFKSDISLSAIIHRKQLNTKEKLDDFIDYHTEADHGHIKFSTLTICNDWTKKMSSGTEYLDELPCEDLVLFNEIKGQIYRGCVIKRYDQVVNDSAEQSYKAHLNGQIIKSWDRDDLIDVKMNYAA